jgi:autotransporter-associated beta strand protein
VLRLISPNSLGNSNNVTVTGGALQIDTNLTIGDRQLTLNGTGFLGNQFGTDANLGAVELLPNRTATWGNGTSSLTLGSPSFIGVDAGAALTLNGTMSGAFALTKVGTGTLEMQGSASNTNSGTTTILDGTIRLNKLPGATSGVTYTVGDHLGTDVLEIAQPEQLSDTATQTVNSSGILQTVLFPSGGAQSEIQQLTPNGSRFQVTLGGATTAILPANIAPSGGTFSQTNEVQAFRFNQLFGTFTLTFLGFTTDPLNPLNFNATPDQVKAALESLPSIGVGNVDVVSSNPLLPTGPAQNPNSYLITFKGQLGGKNLPLIVANTLTGQANNFSVIANTDGTTFTDPTSSLQNALNALPTKPANITYSVTGVPGSLFGSAPA